MAREVIDIKKEVENDIKAVNLEIESSEDMLSDLLRRDINTRVMISKLLMQQRSHKDMLLKRYRELEFEEKYGIKEKELRLEKLETEIEVMKGLGSEIEDLGGIYGEMYGGVIHEYGGEDAGVEE